MADTTNYRLGELVDIVSGGTPSTTEPKYWNGNISWFTPTELGKTKYIQTSSRKITDLGLKESSAKLIPKNSLILSTRASIGDVSINTDEVTTNQGIHSLIIRDSNIYLEYLFYLMESKKRELIKYSTGSTFLEIGRKELNLLKVNIHDIDRQKVIGNMFKYIDDQIYNYTLQKELLEQKKKHYLNVIFNDKNGEKDKFQYKDLGDVLMFENGKRKAITESNRIGGCYPYYGATGIVDYINHYTFQEKRLLIGEDGAKWGRNQISSFIADGFYNVNNHAHVTYSNKYDIVFIMEYLNYIDIEKFSTGNAPAKLTLSNLKKVKVPEMAIKEQEDISNLFTTINENIMLLDNIIYEYNNKKKHFLNEIFN